ncbi:hypothetical protein M406DRAFT_259260 [Cryphonectria parasitica EP155]|uniref:Phosphoribosylaminoimidazole-succinocarboxamide synthase n=1 Tax=Cryphonectria parasitica (strain ATCC 38755 / EP155) TaxID=660469 RepID=A0A9P4Y1Y4_CRYP1|nr:uncharacterized protein M406DRAFT_259260 [Cryphonectria parasitica EP155]KAF3765014.1 hypothetical protein M406DRAFT_259260 [Cryphonectria parasitica EP155]
MAQNRPTNPPIPMMGRPLEEFRDPLALEAARVTPGIDDTPYIQYAIEQLTREREGESSHPSTMTSDGQPFVPGSSRGYYAPSNGPMSPRSAAAASSRHNDHPRQSMDQSAPLLSESGQRPSSNRSSMSTLVKGTEKGAKFAARQPAADAWEPVDPGFFSDGREKINPRLVFRPAILRKPSMIMLLVACMLMLAALIFSAVFSQRHTGLWDYVGTIYSGQYFLFRVLPAIIGAFVLFWAQNIVTTMLRVRPFARLAATQGTAREDAIFDDLYPTSFLRPQLVGTWHIWVPNLITWLMNFTLPLLSCLYTVIYVDGQWRWATVQGVAWTLVALYVLLAAAVVIEMSCWLVRKTGLMWDPRSIADVATIVANSNTLDDYRGTEILATRDQMRRVLYKRRTDMLTYWRWADRERSDELWYTLGQQDDWDSPVSELDMLDEKGRPRSPDSRAQPKHAEDINPWGDIELEGHAMHPRVRYRHLPFCLKDCPLIVVIISGFFLVVALFDLDLHLRILQPWAELAFPPAGGAQPEASILADYAACYPLQASFRALRNRHWRVAFISFLSALFVFIPIFAGGMFLALTPADNIVRVYPQIPLFSITLALVAVYWLALVSLFPKRQGLRLPHAVTCLAEIISFVANEDCVHEDAFSSMIRNKTSLVGKLGVDRRDEDKPRWTLHMGGGGARDERLGVRRVRRYTEKDPATRDPAAVRLMGSPELGSGGGGGGGGGPMGSSLGARAMGESRREARMSARDGVRVSPQYVFPAREA